MERGEWEIPRLSDLANEEEEEDAAAGGGRTSPGIEIGARAQPTQRAAVEMEVVVACRICAGGAQEVVWSEVVRNGQRQGTGRVLPCLGYQGACVSVGAGAGHLSSPRVDALTTCFAHSKV